MPILTTATSHRTKATLREVAQSHARSRSLSEQSRGVFRDIVAGCTINDDNVELHREDAEAAFFEAAVSLSTRYGQSYARRCAGSDLHALRDHVLSGGSVAATTTTITLTVESATAEQARAMVDTLRRFRTDDATITAADITN